MPNHGMGAMTDGQTKRDKDAIYGLVRQDFYFLHFLTFILFSSFTSSLLKTKSTKKYGKNR